MFFRKLQLLLPLAFILILSSCGDKYEDCPREFKLTGELTPYQMNYSIGDTITITSIFSKDVLEKELNESFDMTGVSWNPVLIISKIDTSVGERNFSEYFDHVVNDEYNFSINNNSNGDFLDGQYKFEDSQFKLEVEFIPKDTGLFIMGLGSVLLDSDQDFAGKCKKVTFEACMRLNEGMDNNIMLLEESPDEHYNTWILEKPEERFYGKGGFAFRVVE